METFKAFSKSSLLLLLAFLLWGFQNALGETFLEHFPFFGTRFIPFLGKFLVLIFGVYGGFLFGRDYHNFHTPISRFKSHLRNRVKKANYLLKLWEKSPMQTNELIIDLHNFSSQFQEYHRNLVTVVNMAVEPHSAPHFFDGNANLGSALYHLSSGKDMLLKDIESMEQMLPKVKSIHLKPGFNHLLLEEFEY